MATPDKIIIRTPNWLGDLMMSTAFIKEVLRINPQSTVDLIVKKGFEKIPLPHRGRILPFDKSTVSAWTFGKQLRAEKYDRFYVLPPSISSALMAFASRAGKRYGYKGNMRGTLLNFGIAYKTKHRSQHLVQEYTQLLEDQNINDPTPPGLIIENAWLESTLQQLEAELPEKFVCVAPGVIYGPAKQWPIEYFKDLVSRIKQQIPVVIIGTASDRALGDLLKNNHKDIYNICGQTNLNQLIAVMATSKALISNDSGTMHVMAALQKPQIAIFGSTSTIWTGPLNQHAVIIKLDLECSPCFKRECPLHHTNCLKQISPDMVWEKLEPLLS